MFYNGKSVENAKRWVQLARQLKRHDELLETIIERTCE